MDLQEYLKAIKSSNRNWAERIRQYNLVGSSSIDAYSYIIGALKILHPNITYRELCRSITDDDFEDSQETTSNEDQLDDFIDGIF